MNESKIRKGANKPGNGHSRVGMRISLDTGFFDPDFNQDDLAGRYGAARDRRVLEKPRLARSKVRGSGAGIDR